MGDVKCSVCGAPAVVHLQQIEGEIERTVDLCETCARNYGVLSHSPLPFSIVQSVSTTLFSQLGTPQPRTSRRCSRCGCTAETLIKESRVGCAQCYEDLKPDLMTMLRQTQASSQHIGRQPKQLRLKKSPNTPDVLVAQLKKAIEEERFEEAATLRDQLSQHELG